MLISKTTEPFKNTVMGHANWWLQELHQNSLSLKKKQWHVICCKHLCA